MKEKTMTTATRTVIVTLTEEQARIAHAALMHRTQALWKTRDSGLLDHDEVAPLARANVEVWRLIGAAIDGHGDDPIAALRDLRAIIHDDLTHDRQRDHAEALARADAILGKASEGA